MPHPTDSMFSAIHPPKSAIQFTLSHLEPIPLRPRPPSVSLFPGLPPSVPRRSRPVGFPPARRSLFLRTAMRAPREIAQYKGDTQLAIQDSLLIHFRIRDRRPSR